MRKMLLLFAWAVCQTLFAQQPVDYVNPFIGTTNYGTCHPGAMVPNGLMSVVPFNVMGSSDNVFDKDKRWFSTPYDHRNRYTTGFSHVNLSGVGCPDMGSLLVMATAGELEVDYRKYGSLYQGQVASPGYYAHTLTGYDIRCEATATQRVGATRFTFGKGGESHILLNLGEGLTNESGATVRRVSDTEIEGSKLLGTFCYVPDAVFPIYFVMRVNKKPISSGYWKLQREMGVESAWDRDAGKYKRYHNYAKEMSGDDIGVFFNYDLKEGEQVEVQLGVSFVSIANARENLEAEQPTFAFDTHHRKARQQWNDDLSRVTVEGGTEEDKWVFYTALYHTLVHPSILQDVNGEYPKMESHEIGTTKSNRYTVFSLWDTYRNVHQLMTLLYPERQLEMIETMLQMYREHGWLPKWELFGRETLTMEGDPAIPVIVDTWLKGLRGFDIDLAYEAMRKGATTQPSSQNLLRPDIDDYITYGYCPLREEFDNSVSHALEYYLADWNLAQIASHLGKHEDAKLFHSRAMGYKNYYCKEYGTFRPRTPDGKFLTPFSPNTGANFEPSPGFHEGNAWNYTFYVPHDVMGLAKLMRGKKPFVEKLQWVFDEELFDMTNEPDIAYPHLFTYFKGEEWRTQTLVRSLLKQHFRNAPNGLPGNDDTGTMSAWAVFNMMGFYPDCPGKPSYTLTTPVFDKVTLHLSPAHYPTDKVVIETQRSSPDSYLLKGVKVGGKPNKTGYFISHESLVSGETITFETK